MPLTLALSTLCENPRHRTGLTTLFFEFIRHARLAYPEISWIVFAGALEKWPTDDAGVLVCRDFPSNEHSALRLLADHFLVARRARRLGAAALLTVGFYPVISAGLPIVTHVFAVHHRSQTGIRSWYRRFFVAQALKRSALVIVNSAWARVQLGDVLAPVLVSPEGLQREMFQPSGPRGRSDLAPSYVLWASNFYSYKRCELALEAYASLPEAVRDRLPFFLVGGEWGGGRARARALALELGIERSVRFLGWVDDAELPVLYRGARVHLLSSEEETFGRSVLEAMACGCPNLIQDLPVFHEVAGDSAAYVDFTDRAKAAESLLRVCTDDTYVRELAEAGLIQAGQFGFARLAQERVAGILEALKQRSA